MFIVNSLSLRMCRYKSNVSGLLKACFEGGEAPVCLKKYMEDVYQYEYDETPNYVLLKSLFTKELKDNGWKDNKDGIEWLSSGTTKRVYSGDMSHPFVTTPLSPFFHFFV